MKNMIGTSIGVLARKAQWRFVISQLFRCGAAVQCLQKRPRNGGRDCAPALERARVEALSTQISLISMPTTLRYCSPKFVRHPAGQLLV